MFTWIFANLLPLLSGGLVKNVLDHLDKKADSETERERIRTQATIEEIKAAVEVQNQGKELLIAEQGRWYTAAVRPLMVAPFVIFLWKVIVWDKVLGWGTTDALSESLWLFMTTIAGTYFVGRTAEKITGVVTQRKQR